MFDHKQDEVKGVEDMSNQTLKLAVCCIAIAVLHGCDEPETEPLDGVILTRRTPDTLAAEEPAKASRAQEDLDSGMDSMLARLDPKPWTHEEIDRGVATRAPLLSRIELDGGVTIRLLGADDDAVAVSISGPDNASIARVLPLVAAAPSPLDLHRSLSPEGADIPPLLAEYSDRVVESGNWVPRSAPMHLASTPPDPQSAACGGITASGPGNLEANHGNCDQFSRDQNESTNWRYTDVLAYGGNVVADSGDDLRWTVQRQNCNISCGWSVIDDITINNATGLAHVLQINDVDDDFNVDSFVRSLENNTVHVHDVGRCHDYWGRNNALINTLAGGCRIEFDFGSTHAQFYCQHIDYEGLDPSIISTDSSWLGNGTDISCP